MIQIMGSNKKGHKKEVYTCTVLPQEKRKSQINTLILFLKEVRGKKD